MNAEIVARLEQSLEEPVDQAATSYRSLLFDITSLLDNREDKLLKELKTFLEQWLGSREGKT